MSAGAAARRRLAAFLPAGSLRQKAAENRVS